MEFWLSQSELEVRNPGRDGGILNITFNFQGFTIASGPSDTLEIRDRSGLNTLVIENWLIQ